MNDNSHFCLSEFSSDKEIIKEMRKSTRQKSAAPPIFLIECLRRTLTLLLFIFMGV